MSRRPFAGIADTTPFTRRAQMTDRVQSHGLTLAQEARQTARHDHSFWNQDSKLRNVPVTFHSAGVSEPLKDEQSAATADSGSRIQEHTDNPNDSTKTRQYVDSSIVITAHPVISNPDEITAKLQDAVIDERDPDSTVQQPFFYDLAGDTVSKPKRTVSISIPERQTSPESSSSEVIIFRGRNRSARSRGPSDVFPVHVQAPASQNERLPAAKDKMERHATLQQAETALDVRHGKTKGRERRRRHRLGHVHDNPSGDAILDDYIANVMESGEFDDFKKCLGATSLEHRRTEPDAHNAKEATEMDGGDFFGRTKEAYSSGSELDDEAFARLIAGQGLDPRSDNGQDESSQSDRDSPDIELIYSNQRSIEREVFDVMDWERPSLQRKKGKGSRPWPKFTDGDSEMEQQLQVAWNNDRLKKKQRKKEREELRALGILGQKTTKPEDLQTKYPAGISTAEIAEELRTFLVCKHEILLFPPMDLHARKIVHELANQFKITSKSTGKGQERRPTLHRTNRTRMFVESSFDHAVARINRRFMPRPGAKGKRAGVKATITRGSHAVASYRDGEVVGGSAPELGTENRGRAILEKMGWSSGTALGATDNKGILQPVTHTMKRSKAGLG
ncbi:hypothetical protein HIM_10201 [Hirsutella minnesotensis 3608]|uniref:Protein SQS1 n=1 Tax=Hirsutella minnesotensis 3608 TaxID=1043627 RepID=A0A0F7ZXA8_9HYPO|nr:hypothetical protein HIM_10201 [Hirsutella minnesotensis 3608]